MNKQALTRSPWFSEVSTPVLGGCRIELFGNRRAVIECCDGVLEYGSTAITVKAGKFRLQLCGRNLHIKCLSANAVVVEGFLTGVDYGLGKPGAFSD